MLKLIPSMKLLWLLLHLNKRKQKIISQSADQKQKEALIQTGKQQFKKLHELGLKIPIAAL